MSQFQYFIRFEIGFAVSRGSCEPLQNARNLVLVFQNASAFWKTLCLQKIRHKKENDQSCKIKLNDIDN
ncbi:MAG: hypothetical protein LWX00_02965, partial [Spirochaetia bacterium]|nr:hypothetical protein [Spirochaetia bacterium]